MTFEYTYNIGDLLTEVSVIVVIIGGIFSLIQWMRKQKLQRGEYINKLTEKIQTDEDIKEIVYLLDYNDKVWYTKKFHGSGEIERKSTKLCLISLTFVILRKKD